MLVEAAHLLGRPAEVAQYTYYGFGGAYLEDFRLMHEHFPKMRMISFEKNLETFKRQQFHLPCSYVTLVRSDFRSYIAKTDIDSVKAIFWLDYLDFELRPFEDFKLLLEKAASSSIIKITVRCDGREYQDPVKAAEFRAKFDALLPSGLGSVPTRVESFATLIQEMLQIAAQQALPTSSGFSFLPIYTSYYVDSNGMFSLCGTVCNAEEVGAIRDRFKEHPIANLGWGPPTELDVPLLSTKERLLLQKYLPCDGDAGAELSSILGYKIDNTQAMSERRLKQYAAFYSQYPLFVKATP